MPKIVYYIGSALLWLLTASGITWWVLTAIQVYEVQWAVLACSVILFPVLFCGIYTATDLEVVVGVFEHEESDGQAAVSGERRHSSPSRGRRSHRSAMA